LPRCLTDDILQLMNKAAKTTTQLPYASSPAQSPITGTVLALQLLDTSWRIALPIVVLSIIGVRLDQHFHTRPVLTIGSMLLALIISVTLVYKQIAAAYPEFLHGKTQAKGGQK